VKKKSPIAAFLLNFILGGIGFSYLKISPILTLAGILVLLGSIIEGFGSKLENISTSSIIGGLIAALGLGLAGYALAEHLNKSLTTQQSPVKQPSGQTETPIYCSACGTKNEKDAKYCVSCGKPV